MYNNFVVQFNVNMPIYCVHTFYQLGPIWSAYLIMDLFFYYYGLAAHISRYHILGDAIDHYQYVSLYYDRDL